MTPAEEARAAVEAWWDEYVSHSEYGIIDYDGRNEALADLATRLTPVFERAQAAEAALKRHGYRRSCDIPACNCGDQWEHRLSAETGAREEAQPTQKRAAIAIVKEWYDLCHENPLDTRVLKRLIAAELTARDRIEGALRERAERLERRVRELEAQLRELGR